MKDNKKKIIYASLVAGLFLSPLIMPGNGINYASVACCFFVLLCFIFKVQSILKTIIPVFIYSVFAPVAILIAIARPISKTWSGAATYFYQQFNSSFLLSFLFPVLLSLILHFGLSRVSVFKKLTA
ncbi:MAG: hypothetical protein ACYC69_18315 [Thermodesulfovibrionales bacterium]